MAAKISIGFFFATCLAFAIVQSRSVSVRDTTAENNSTATTSNTTNNYTNVIEDPIGNGMSMATQVIDNAQSNMKSVGGEALKLGNAAFDAGMNMEKLKWAAIGQAASTTGKMAGQLQNSILSSFMGAGHGASNDVHVGTNMAKTANSGASTDAEAIQGGSGQIGNDLAGNLQYGMESGMNGVANGASNAVGMGTKVANAGLTAASTGMESGMNGIAYGASNAVGMGTKVANAGLTAASTGMQAGMNGIAYGASNAVGMGNKVANAGLTAASSAVHGMSSLMSGFLGFGF